MVETLGKYRHIDEFNALLTTHSSYRTHIMNNNSCLLCNLDTIYRTWHLLIGDCYVTSTTILGSYYDCLKVGGVAVSEKVLAMASGRETREYKTVLEHIGNISYSLQGNSAAKQALTFKYQEKQWINIYESPDETSLVRLALTRISFDPSQYRIFMGMLKDITGMDFIVKIIEGMAACSHLNCGAKLCLCYFIQLPTVVEMNNQKVYNLVNLSYYTQYFLPKII